MEYKHLGRTGLRVSPLCLGTMNFGPVTSETDSFTIMDKVASGTQQVRLRWTDTWVKQTDGRWLCVAAQSAIIKE